MATTPHAPPSTSGPASRHHAQNSYQNESLSSHLLDLDGLNHFSPPLPAGHPPQKPWKASASPNARRASAVALLVLSEDERAELDDCFQALAGATGSVVTLKQVMKAYELVLGPECSSEKTARAAFETMGPNISGQVDRAMFRAYMISNWAAPSPTPEASGTESRRRSIEGCDLGNMRLSDVIRMYRRKTLAERTLKKAQQQVHMVLGDGGAKAAAGGSSKEAHGHAAPSRKARRNLGDAADAQRQQAQASEAAVPLSRFRRASMLMLESALAAAKQSTAVTTEATVTDCCSDDRCTQEAEAAPVSVDETSAAAEELADADFQLAWERQVLARCGLSSSFSQQEPEAEVDAEDHPFVPLQPPVLEPRPLTPQPPLTPRKPRDPVTGRREGSMMAYRSQVSFESFDAAYPQAEVTQLSGEVVCGHGERRLSRAMTSPNPCGEAARPEAACSRAGKSCLGLGTSSSGLPRSEGNSCSQLGNWEQAGDSSPMTSLFQGFSTDQDQPDDGSQGSSCGSEDEAESNGRRRRSGLVTTSWIAKRLTRFMHRDEPANQDVRMSRSPSLVSSISVSLQRATQSCSSLQPTPSPSSQSLALHRGLSTEEQEGRQCAMPQPAGSHLENMLRRRSSSRGLLPSVAPSAQPMQLAPQALLASGSRSTGLQPSSAMKAKSSVIGMMRMDKAIVDVHWQMTQKAFVKRDRWNMV